MLQKRGFSVIVVLHVRQNPPLLTLCAQMIGFVNSLCYAEGLNFTFYTQYIAQAKSSKSDVNEDSLRISLSVTDFC